MSSDKTVKLRLLGTTTCLHCAFLALAEGAIEGGVPAVQVVAQMMQAIAEITVANVTSTPDEIVLHTGNAWRTAIHRACERFASPHEAGHA